MKDNINNIQPEIPFSNQNQTNNSELSNIDTSKNNQQTTKINLNNFDDDLNISEINNVDNINNAIRKVSIDTVTLTNQIKDLTVELDDFDEDFENKDKNQSINESSKAINKTNDEPKKKIKKEDLDNTPIPIFSCIYCTNEKLVFVHFSNEIISEKYLYQTSIYDIDTLNKIIEQPLIIKEEKNEKLLNLIIKNTEYLKNYYQFAESNNFLKSNKYIDFCISSTNKNHKLLKEKIEHSLVRKKKDFYFKGINKIVSRNSQNNKCLFNTTNSLINNYNALNGICEQTPNVNNNTIISIIFNSISINNNESNNNILDNGIEKIEINDNMEIDDKEDNEIINIFSLDNSNKIGKKNIVWDNQYYDIWNPVFCDVNEKINIERSEIKNKINTKNKSFLYNKNNKKIDINKLYTDLKDSRNKNTQNIVKNKKCHKNSNFFCNNFNNKYNKNEVLITLNQNNSLYIKYNKYNKYSKLNSSIINNSNTHINNNIKKSSSSCIKSFCSTTNNSSNMNKSLKFNYNEKLNKNALKYESSPTINKKSKKDFSICFISKSNLLKSFNHSSDNKNNVKNNLNKSLFIKNVQNSLSKNKAKKRYSNNKSAVCDSNIKIHNSLKFSDFKKHSVLDNFTKKSNISKNNLEKIHYKPIKNISHANKNNRSSTKNKIKNTNYKHDKNISFVNKNNRANSIKKNSKILKSPKLCYKPKNCRKYSDFILNLNLN